MNPVMVMVLVVGLDMGLPVKLRHLHCRRGSCSIALALLCLWFLAVL